MKHAKKMILTEYDPPPSTTATAANMRLNNAYADSEGFFTKPTSNVLFNLDSDMQGILARPDLTDREKWQLYNKSLQRYQEFMNQKRKTALGFNALYGNVAAAGSTISTDKNADIMAWNSFGTPRVSPINRPQSTPKRLSFRKMHSISEADDDDDDTEAGPSGIATTKPVDISAITLPDTDEEVEAELTGKRTPGMYVLAQPKRARKESVGRARGGRGTTVVRGLKRRNAAHYSMDGSGASANQLSGVAVKSRKWEPVNLV